MIQPKTPAWVKDAVFYQIFPDRFAKSQVLAKPSNLEPWDTPPTTHGYKGGDLLGVVERLDYLQDLGINAVYFTPIFQSASNHRYHTHDYYEVDPLLGGNKAFRTLREETARRGMRLVLDGVFNHASRGNFFFNDILENGPHSAWLDWFCVHDWPVAAYDESRPANYEGWVGNRALPRWNTENPQVREYLMRVGEHWIKEGIDGWRLDVAFEVTSPGFWHEFRQRVKALNPDAYIIGEIWWDSRNYLRGDQFDGVMNYMFTEPVIRFTGQEHLQYDMVQYMTYDAYPAIDARHYADRIEFLGWRYHWEAHLGQLNLLDSHDTPRFRSIVNGDEAAMRLATLLMLTFPGAPSIYYGNEIGMAGGPDPDCRRSFPWDHPEQWDQASLAYHKQFIALRHQYPALRQGRYLRLFPSREQRDEAARAVYAFARQHDDETVVVAVNVSNASHTVTIPTAGLFANDPPQTVVGPAQAATLTEGHLELRLPPRDALVLVSSPRG
jgi:cyclomaltodextrinase